jgi:hypothetical protein
MMIEGWDMTPATADRVDTGAVRDAVRVLVGRVYPGAVAAVLVFGAAGHATGVRCGRAPWPVASPRQLAPAMWRKVRTRLDEAVPGAETPRVVVTLPDNQIANLPVPV